MRPMRSAVRIAAMASVLLEGACVMAQESNKVAAAPQGSNEVAVVETEFGKMAVAFYDKDAPKTVANFKKLAKDRFYDGTTFHRIVQSFMIQGGDPLSKTPDNPNVGTGGPGYQIAAEFNTNKHVLGVISMARSSDPNSAGSQFFICLGDATFLDGKYTAFGKLIAGEDVLKKIGAVPTKMDRSGREKSVPEERVVIEKIYITTRVDVPKK